LKVKNQSVIFTFSAHFLIGGFCIIRTGGNFRAST